VKSFLPLLLAFFMTTFDDIPTPEARPTPADVNSLNSLEDEDNPLVKLTMTYVKRYKNYKYRPNHFRTFLKDEGLLTSHSKALTQLDSFLTLYFPATILRQSFVLPQNRYAPYPRPPLGQQVSNSVAEEESISSTPPSTPPTSSTPPTQLKRGGSMMDIEIEKTIGPIAQAFAEASPSAPVNISVNIFNALSSDPEYTEKKQVSEKAMQVTVFLPDDCKVVLSVLPSNTVSDLRYEVRRRMLARYPAKTEDDIPLERIVIKTRGGWPLNFADRLGEVIHETTIIQCYFNDF